MIETTVMKFVVRTGPDDDGYHGDLQFKIVGIGMVEVTDLKLDKGEKWWGRTVKASDLIRLGRILEATQG